MRQIDLAARYGGEEFVVLVPESDLKGATQLAKRLRLAVSKARTELADGRLLKVTASFGVAVKGDLTTAERLVAAADEALYEAKRAGKNRVVAAEGPRSRARGPPPRPGRGRVPQSRTMRVSAKVDYALRARAELAAAASGVPQKGERIARAQKIPLKFLENILLDLKHAGLVQSQRGADGGYWLASTPDEITLAEVIRAVEGPIANVRGERPEQVEYAGAAEPLRDVWVAVRANLRAVLETVTLADLASGRAARRGRA